MVAAGEAVKLLDAADITKWILYKPRHSSTEGRTRRGKLGLEYPRL